MTEPEENPWVRVMHKVVEDLSYNKEIFDRISKYYLLKQANTKARAATELIFDDHEHTYEVIRDAQSKHSVGFLPLFETLSEPSQAEVGNVISLSCGHAMRPTDNEANYIH